MRRSTEELFDMEEMWRTLEECAAGMLPKKKILVLVVGIALACCIKKAKTAPAQPSTASASSAQKRYIQKKLIKEKIAKEARQFKERLPRQFSTQEKRKAATEVKCLLKEYTEKHKFIHHKQRIAELEELIQAEAGAERLELEAAVEEKVQILVEKHRVEKYESRQDYIKTYTDLIKRPQIEDEAERRFQEEETWKQRKLERLRLALAGWEAERSAKPENAQAMKPTNIKAVHLRRSLNVERNVNTSEPQVPSTSRAQYENINARQIKVDAHRQASSRSRNISSEADTDAANDMNDHFKNERDSYENRKKAYKDKYYTKRN